MVLPVSDANHPLTPPNCQSFAETCLPRPGFAAQMFATGYDVKILNKISLEFCILFNIKPLPHVLFIA